MTTPSTSDQIRTVRLRMLADRFGPEVMERSSWIHVPFGIPEGKHHFQVVCKACEWRLPPWPVVEWPEMPPKTMTFRIVVLTLLGHIAGEKAMTWIPVYAGRCGECGTGYWA